MRSSLLFDIGVQANIKFNAIVVKFMETQMKTANVNPDEHTRQLENQTVWEIRDSQQAHLQLSYSVEKVYDVLIKMRWYINSEIRTVRPVSSSSIMLSTPQTPCNFTALREGVCEHDEDMDIDEVEEANAQQEKDHCFESVFPAEFDETIAWACGERYLTRSFPCFMSEYSEWKHKHENAMLLNVKQQSDIEVMPIEDLHIARHTENRKSPGLHPDSNATLNPFSTLRRSSVSQLVAYSDPTGSVSLTIPCERRLL